MEYDNAVSPELEFEKLGEAASRLEVASKTLCAEAKKLALASVTGNIQSIRKLRTSIDQASFDASSAANEVRSFNEEPILRSIGTRRFLQEIVEIAARIGLHAVRVSGLSVLSFPNRLVADDKGLIKIGRKPFPYLRPSFIARHLKAAAESAMEVQPGFLEALGSACRAKTDDISQPVLLTDIYELLTLMPEVRKNYSEADFVRDLSIIDSRGPHRTKDGRTIAFIASTGARMNAGYRGVSPSGEEVTYVSIRFDNAT